MTNDEGFGFAGFALATGLLSTMKAKGLLSPLEIRELIDGALLAIEETLGKDAALTAARAFLGGLPDVSEGRVPKD